MVGIDNLITGDLANIAHLSGRDFVFVRHLPNYISVDGPVDRVYHWGSQRPDRLSGVADPALRSGRRHHNALGLANKGAIHPAHLEGRGGHRPSAKEACWGNVDPSGRAACERSCGSPNDHDGATGHKLDAKIVGPTPARACDSGCRAAELHRQRARRDVTIFGGGKPAPATSCPCRASRADGIR